MNNLKIIIAVAISGTILLFSCNSKNLAYDESPVVASVYDYSLTLSKLSKQIPDDLSAEDSLVYAKRIIDTWARNKLIFERAQNNLSEEQSVIDEQVEEFRQSLYIHKYEQKLINSTLDFSVNDDAIYAYYQRNKAEMLLGNDIAKANFLKVKKNLTEDEPIRQWIASKHEDDIDNLKNFGFQFASKFSFSEEWLDVSFIFSQMPKSISNEKNVLRYKYLVEDSDSTYYYYLLITDYLPKNDTAPVTYVRANIEEILLQMKKNKLLQETKNKLFEDAKSKNIVKFY